MREEARSPWPSMLLALGVTGACFTAAWMLQDSLAESDLVMIFLGGVIVVAFRAPWPIALGTAALVVLLFDLFFVPPRFTFRVAEARYLLTFAVMGTTGVLVSLLASRTRRTTRARDRLQEEVERERLRAEAEEVRSAVLGSVSHDLRTPVGSILGAATTLADVPDLDSGTRRDLARSIAVQARHLARQLDNLLQMTRIEGGGLRLHIEWQSPEEVVGAAVALLEERVNSTLDRDALEIAIEGPHLARFDAVAMEVVLLNLLENAVRHGRPPIRIVASRRTRTWSLTVSDQGDGFMAEDLPRAFDKFHRGVTSRGSGLGLAVVRALVEAQGGSVWARNADGAGAEVGLTMPLDEPPPAPHAVEEPAR